MPDSTVVGIDISKTHLDTYMAPAGKAARFTNDAAGFNALIAWIDQPVRSVVYEPTGPWHRAFEEALLRAGLPLARANPLQARRFAQAMGQRAGAGAANRWTLPTDPDFTLRSEVHHAVIMPCLRNAIDDHGAVPRGWTLDEFTTRVYNETERVLAPLAADAVNHAKGMDATIHAEFFAHAQDLCYEAVVEALF